MCTVAAFSNGDWDVEHTNWSVTLLRLSGSFVGLGAAMMALKGVLLMTTGNDRSLVPWFAFLTSIGFCLASAALWRTCQRWRFLAVVGGVAAAVGVGAAIISVGYLVTGTIPETPDAPGLVGLSYAVSSAAIALAIVSLGILILVNRSLTGRWRWLPIGLILAQLPIFIVSGAIGDTAGSEDVTDGLGLALTGAAWMLLGWAIAYRHQPQPTGQSVARSSAS